MAKNDKGMIFAVSFSSAAISASLVFFGMQMGGSGISQYSEQELQAEIFKGIEAYVEKKEDEYKEQVETAKKPTPAYPEFEGDFADDDPFMGQEDAPVVIVEFSDYKCYYCGVFYDETLGKIKENYIDTGKVKFVYRDYTAKSGSKEVATSAECVRLQGGDEAYFEVHDYIFEEGYSLSGVLALADNLGLDSSEVEQCIEDDTFADEIANDMEAAQSIVHSSESGFGTPTFMVGNVRVRGAQGYDVFVDLIEEQLAE